MNSDSTATKATKPAASERDPRLQAILDRVNARQERAELRRMKQYRAGMADAIAPLLGLTPSRPSWGMLLKGAAPEGYAAGYIEGVSVAANLRKLMAAKHETTACLAPLKKTG